MSDGRPEFQRQMSILVDSSRYHDNPIPRTASFLYGRMRQRSLDPTNDIVKTEDKAWESSHEISGHHDHRPNPQFLEDTTSRCCLSSTHREQLAPWDNAAQCSSIISRSKQESQSLRQNRHDSPVLPWPRPRSHVTDGARSTPKHRILN